MTQTCPHEAVHCLNPFEFIRKYRCETCAAVMMCSCDEAFGRQFLAHQLDQGVELKTQARVPVTLEFEPGVCRECRGLPAEPAPKAPGYGATSKIKRYYWRELWFEETRRFQAWLDGGGDPDEADAEQVRDEIARKVLEEMKAAHTRAPKYLYDDPSDDQILSTHKVRVEALRAKYVTGGRKGALIAGPSGPIGPERFATEIFERRGRTVLALESAPVIALFAVMMWLVISDPTDPSCRAVMFEARDDYEAGRSARKIFTTLPQDFGTSGYAERRALELEAHFQMLAVDREKQLGLFDLWLEPSETLRQYLWAHRAGDIACARRLIEVLPPDVIVAILRYLADAYWDHYLGWPDLLVLGPGEDFELVEVKSSKDSLSEDQKRWIADNATRLQLPFRIAKIHRDTAT